MQFFFSRLGFILAVLLLTAALPQSLYAQKTDNTLETIKKSGVISIAVPQDFPPLVLWAQICSLWVTTLILPGLLQKAWASR